MGASLGGAAALRAIASALPKDFPAPILIVLHVNEPPSVLPNLLETGSSLSAAHAVDGEPLRPGHIHVAPPDHHMVVVGRRITLLHGPKEHHTRPAIDPLFRSAAIARGVDVIGVVLTGRLDDGTAGLQAIKAAGGTAIVQDPDDALAPSMPASAQRYADVDHCVSLPLIPLLLRLLVAPRVRLETDRTAPEHIYQEHQLTLQHGNPMQVLQAIASPSTFACPDCHGRLWKILNSHPLRFRCQNGHGFTARTLHKTVAEVKGEAMTDARCALQERGILLRWIAHEARAGAFTEEATRLDAAAHRVHRQAEMLDELIGHVKE